MGDNTAEDQEVIEEVEVEEVVKTEEENPSEETAESTETEEVEIVRESEGSQPISDNQTGIRKRINKLNSKVTAANEATSGANAELELEKEKTKLLNIALEQAKQSKPAPTAPNPDDFDEGINDPGYIKQHGEYTQSIIQQQVATQVAAATQQSVQTVNLNTQSQALQQKQVKHYERVNEMGIKNYSEIEDKAIGILGNETVIQIIDNFDDAHIILAYLGTDKNLSEAENLANLIKTNPIQGVAAIGGLRKDLKVRPKTKTAPDPDTEIKGDTPPKMNADERKLDKLREQATKTGDMKPLMDFKRKIASRA